MASSSCTHQMSRDEIKRLEKALETPEFLKLFADYVSEINDVDKRAQYEREVIELEKGRGYDVTFINPEPGYVLKVVTTSECKLSSCATEVAQKVFINIASSECIDKPTYKRVSSHENGLATDGTSWTIPHALSPQRHDKDKLGRRCTVYDCVFHPDALQHARDDVRLKTMIDDIAIESVESNFKTKLDRTQIKSPKMKYKGTPVPTLKRTKISGMSPSSLPIEDYLKTLTMSADDVTPSKTPEYSIKYRHHHDLQDYAYMISSVEANHPSVELVITIKLPLVETCSEVQLDVKPNELHLKSAETSTAAHSYDLRIRLPCAVREDDGKAQFDFETKVLSVVLPTYKDEAQTEPCTLEQNVAVARNSSKLEVDESRLTEELSKLEIESKISDNDKNKMDDRNTDHDVNLCAIPAVDTSKSLLPEFSCHQDEKEIVFVLKTENVVAKSLKIEYLHEGQACHIQYSSVGSGNVPFHYSLFLRFPCTCKVDEETTTQSVNEDSVVVIFKKYLTARHNWAHYFYDIDGQHELKEVNMAVNSFQESLNALWGESRKTSDPSQTCAGNPLPVSIVEVSSERLVVNVKEVDETNKSQLAHASDNNEIATKNDLQTQFHSRLSTASEKNESSECRRDSSKKDGKPDRTGLSKGRSISESSDDLSSPSRQRRGILKHSRHPRTVSESSDDLCWSSQDYTTIDSDIPEEDAYNLHTIRKKSVHFDNYILLKKFKLNSSIFGQSKRAAERKWQKNHPQRSSESDYSESETTTNTKCRSRSQWKNKNTKRSSSNSVQNDNDHLTDNNGSDLDSNLDGNHSSHWPNNNNNSLPNFGKGRKTRWKRKNVRSRNGNKVTPTYN